MDECNLVSNCSSLDEYKLAIENGELKEVKTNTYSENQIIAAVAFKKII